MCAWGVRARARGMHARSDGGWLPGGRAADADRDCAVPPLCLTHVYLEGRAWGLRETRLVCDPAAATLLNALIIIVRFSSHAITLLLHSVSFGSRAYWHDVRVLKVRA